jgi:hypothetical protein
MALAAWMADAVEFVRDRPRLAAAAAIAFLAMVAPIWWLGPQRGAAAPSRADQTTPASPRVLDRVLVPPPLPTAGFEQCGSGSMPVIVGGSQLASDMEAAQSAADSALARLGTELAARSTDRDHALGLYLPIIAAPNAASYAACGGDYAACQQALATAIAERQGALVRIATHTTDADAYAMAVYSCMWPFAGRNADCDLVSYGQWAGIEPDNAVPWLYLAGDAQRHGDQSTVEAALYRASKARYSDPHLDQISGLVYSNTAAALSPTFQVELAGTLLSIQGGLPHPNLSVVMHYCGDAGQTIAGHVQTCSDLATMLVERSRAAIDVLIGGRVAEQVSWANPRLAPLRDEADAMRWQLFRMPGSQAQMLPGCDSTQRLLPIATAQAQFGESGRLRQELAARGVTTAQAADAWRAARRWPR